MNVSETITEILNYYKENPGCDPNMYEYIGLCYDMVQYLVKAAPDYGIHMRVNNEETITAGQTKQKYPIAAAVYDKFKILSQNLEQKLLGNDLGITKDSPLYQLYSDCTIGVGTYSAYGDTPLKQKLGDIALYIAQQKRNLEKGLITDFSYGNTQETEEIQRLNKKLHDPQASGHYTGEAGEADINKMTYVEAEPSPRKLLLEEITAEYKRRAKTL